MNPIEQQPLSAVELRKTSALFAALESRPYVAQAVQKYGDTQAVIVSPTLWRLIEQVLEGGAEVFEMPLAHADAFVGPVPSKLVVVEPGETAESWRVMVDWMAYTLEGVTPDPKQLIWRHHPDVAARVVEM